MSKLWAGVVLAVAVSGLGSLHTPTAVHAERGMEHHPVDDPRLVGARDDARRAHARRTDRATTVARVLVEVGTNDTEGVARGLRRIGAEVNGSVPGAVVQALVPVDALEAVAAFGAVTDLQYPRRQGYVPSTPLRRTDVLAHPNAAPGFGATVGGEVVLTKANAWHAAGYTGAGVKVGIVDYFIPSLWNTAENGPVPNAAHQFCKDSFSTTADPTNLCDSLTSIRDNDIHGNAVSEIVKDMAPASELFIASAGTVSDLKAAIDWFHTNGVTIMTRSLGSAYDGPGDGTGEFAKAVDYAVAKGITWFNSAGNEGEDAYMKKLVKTTVAVDGGNYVNVNDGNPTVSPSVDTWLRVDSFDSGCFFMDGVRWANDWYLPAGQRTDYSVEFWQPKLGFDPGNINSHKNPTRAQVEPITLNLIGFGDQGAGGLGGNIINRSQRTGWGPLEAADIGVCPSRISNLTDGTFVTYIRINRNAATSVGAVADRMEVAIAGPALFEHQYFDRAGSAAKPVVDSKNPGLVSVGAVDVLQAYRLTKSDGKSIAWYSSQGPTTDGRTKPDVSSWAGMTSSAYGGTFSGTSASSPTAAGFAALLKGAGLADTPVTLARLVKHQTYDHPPLGPDMAYGFGITQLGAPPAAPDPTSLVGHYTPVAPTRVYDSRQLVLGQQPYARPPGSIIDVPITTLTGVVPAGQASAVAVNITSTGSSAVGFVQAFPWNRTAFGATSTLNINKAGDVVANFAIVPMGDNGTISIYMPVGGHVVVDLMGWFSKNEPTGSVAGRFIPLSTPTQLSTGVLATGAAASASQQIDPAASLPVPVAEASAVVVDVTASGGNRNWYLRAVPSGIDGGSVTPSTLNFTSSGARVTNMAIVPLGADGKIQVYMAAPKTVGGTLLPVSVDVKVDLVGYITSAAATDTDLLKGMFVPIPPTRMSDSRLPAGSLPFSGERTITVGGVLNVFGGTGAPAGALAYSGNWTVTQPVAAGTLSVYADAPPSPVPTYNVSYSTGRSVASGALFAAVPSLGVPGTTTVNAFMSATGHVIIDVNGYFLAATPP